MKLTSERNATTRCFRMSNTRRVALHVITGRNALLWTAAAALLSLPTVSRAVRDPAVGQAILFVVAARDFDFQEYRLTSEAFGSKGFSLTVASTDTVQAIAFNDSVIKPALLLNDVDPSRYAALILIGGVGSILFWDDSAALSLVRSFADSETRGHDAASCPLPRVIGAIGLAPLILAKSGLLKGRAAAVYNDPNAAKILADCGAQFKFNDVVADGQFITANGADAAPKLVRAIAKRLATGKW